MQPADTNWHTVIYNDENHKVLFDGTEKATCPTYSSSNTRQLILFARYDGSVIAFTRSCQLEYCKITDTSTGTLLRDLIPVLDENNVACLYDKVSRNYFYNNGTGEFLYG